MSNGGSTQSRATARSGSRVSQPLAGSATEAAGLDPVIEVLQGAISNRFRTLIHQMAAEAWGRAGDVERSLHHFRAGADTVLLDLEWVDRCPFLGDVRKHPEFAELRRRVRARCEEIWTA